MLSWGCIALIGALMCIFAYKKFNRYARKAGNVKESILSDGKAGKAFMNGEEIHVSNVEDIKDAFVITELPYNHLQYKQTALHLIDQLYGVVGGIRMNGSAAAAICYVAIGRFDAWMEAFLGKWDYSAAALIVQEAGGKVTDFYGEDHFIEGHHIIATNGNLHPVFQKLLLEVPPLNM